MSSILDLLSLQTIINCEIPRQRPLISDNYTLVEKNYDVKITPTTQGTLKYPCVKVYFGKHEILDMGEYLNLYITEEYLFFRVSDTYTENSRKLSFEKVHREKADKGSMGAKIACEEQYYALLASYTGKYILHKWKSDFYYISKSERNQIRSKED